MFPISPEAPVEAVNRKRSDLDPRADWEDEQVVDADFSGESSGAVLHEPSFLRVEFRNCRMAGLVLVNGKLRHVRFVDCKLDESNQRFINAEHVVWEGCSLAGADFMEASLAK